MGVYWGTKRHSWLSYASFWLSISFFLIFLIEVFVIRTLFNSSDGAMQFIKYFYFIFVPLNIIISVRLLFKKNEKKTLPIFSFIVSLLFTSLIVVLALAATGKVL
ncbi:MULTISPECIES: hypothetical protein [Bacillus cereus group]|uniref:Group-specific protein n=1 Tax=Bacillus cereus TaxID=1396 RepID=A0AA44Q6N6_BACCE|nr:MULTISPECIES: hypothetical protein [Bacillus cereus group]EEL51063.1 hypothetical protein bcere0022_16380 [Bacillus cereus Rock3-44]PFA24517.1 hypothetical protein CN373_03410 [Bacillus cereus]PFN04974.1 hypothetical protein COJ55_19670 [Bacillus cereus]PFO84280.1 hypothetical protein COJ77_05580 [Bacillus cereus]PFR25695.1 hypothetical protein COK19_14670 [Bacillus cereus]